MDAETRDAANERDIETVTPLYRAPDPSDHGFIFNSLMLSLRKAYTYIPEDKFFPPVRRLVARVAETAHVLVACDKDLPSFILAYCIAEPVALNDTDFTVHYAYTKPMFRRKGLQWELMRRLGHTRGVTLNVTLPTYRTKMMIRDRKPNRMITIDPFFFAKWV